MGFIATSEWRQLSSKKLQCGHTTIMAKPKIYSITRCYITVQTVQKPFMTLGSLDLFQFVMEVNYTLTLNLISQTLGRKIHTIFFVSSQNCFMTKITTTTLECFQSNNFNISLQCINLRKEKARVAFSRVGWFSQALAFRSLYYPWGKMGDYS